MRRTREMDFCGLEAADLANKPYLQPLNEELNTADARLSTACVRKQNPVNQSFDVEIHCRVPGALNKLSAMLVDAGENLTTF